MNSNADAKTYHNVKNSFFYIELAIDVALLVLFQWSGLSMALRDWAASLSSSVWIIRAIYLALFYAGLTVVHFPIKYFLEFVWEHRFALSTQTFGAWLWDEAKRFVLNLVFLLIFIEIIYYFLSRFPQTWWLAASGAWLFLSLFLARIMPSMIIPLFYKYVPLEDEELRKNILGLFRECGVNVQDVYGINSSSKTRKANAFICGLGKSRRVVLSDTLLQKFSHQEIEAVVAHELGHYKNKDILKLILSNTAVVLASFYVASRVLAVGFGFLDLSEISNIAGLPLLGLTMLLLGLVSAPALNVFSRFLERKADLFSLRLTRRPDDFVSMMEKLGEMNLAEMNPGWFHEMMFFDHPPIPKRVQFAREFQKAL